MSRDRLVETIARTTVVADDGRKNRGTAFLVSRTHALTCAHCLDVGGGVLSGQVELSFSRWPEGDRRRIAKVKWPRPLLDLKQLPFDLAFLELDRPAPDKVHPLPLRMHPAEESFWWSFAHPAPAEDDGVVLDGRIALVVGQRKGRKAIELDCNQASASVGGASGGPVVAQGVVVGVISRELINAESRPMLNKLYAEHLDGLAAAEDEDVRSLLGTRVGERESLTRGLEQLPDDTASRVEAFVAAYLGTSRQPVPFGGRDEDLARLDRFLQGETPRRLLLAAPAGRGKSSLLVHWAARLLARGDVAVVFAPTSVRFETASQRTFLQVIAARLAALQGEVLDVTREQTVEWWRRQVTERLERGILDRRPVVVIVDGLDEAIDWKPTATLFPHTRWPAGVHVVCSVRERSGDLGGIETLRALGWDAPGASTTITLDHLSPEGIAEVLTRMGPPLDALGAREEIVGALHTITRGDPLLVHLYVNDLAGRGAGVAGLEASELAAIDRGFHGYFARWWSEQEQLWEQQRRPQDRPLVQAVLDTLSAALGPLSIEELAALLPPALNANTRSIEKSIRVLSRFLVGDGRQTGFSFSHPQLGAHFRETMLEAERSDIDASFVRWGRDLLTRLRGGALSPMRVPPYLVRHLRKHFARVGGDAEDFCALLDRAWRDASTLQSGDLEHFVEDVEAAREYFRGRDADSQRRGQAARWMGYQARCALILSSIHTAEEKTPPSLAAYAFECGVWTEAQTLGHFRRAPTARRAELAGELVSSKKLGRSLREQLIAWALNDRTRVGFEVLLRLATSPALHLGLLHRALDEALRLDDPHALLNLLQHVAHLALEDKRRVLTSALDVPDAWSRLRLLATLAPHLPGEYHIATRKGALAAARQHLEQNATVSGLCTVIQFSEGEERRELGAEALMAARALPDSERRVQAFVAIAAVCEGSEREAIYEEARVAARATDAPDARAMLLTLLVKESGSAGPLLDEAIAAARLVTDDDQRSLRLVWLAAHGDSEQRAVVNALTLRAAHGIEDTAERAFRLAQLARELPLAEGTAARDEALSLARSVPELAARSSALEVVGLALRGELAQVVRGEALRAARAIEDDALRAAQLTRLIGVLDPQEQETALADALAAARSIVDTAVRSDALLALTRSYPIAPELPIAGEVTRAALESLAGISDAQIEATLVARLGRHLPEDRRPNCRARAFALASGISGERSRARALADIAAELSEGELSQLLDIAFSLGDDDARSRVLLATVERLPVARLHELHAASASVGDLWDRASLLASVATRQDAGGRLPTLLAAWEAARQIPRAEERSRSLARLAIPAPASQQEAWVYEAFQSAATLDNPRVRASTLIDITRNSTGAVRGAAAALAWHAASQAALNDRATSLATCVPCLPASARPEGASTAFDAALEAADSFKLADVLTLIAPHLPPERRGEMRDAARRITLGAPRTDALLAVAAVFHAEERQHMLREVFETAEVDDDLARRTRTLAALANAASGDLRWRCLETSLRLAADARRPVLFDHLIDLLPVLAEVGGQEAVIDLYTALEDVRAMWP